MRVGEGGHDVPSEKITSRIPHLLRQVSASIALVDMLRVYDNASALDPFRTVLTLHQGAFQRHQDPRPNWAEVLIADADRR